MYALLDQAREPLVATASEALIAREASPRLKPVADAGCDVRIRVLGTADIVVPLPAAAVTVIVDVLAVMADARPISVIPTDAELTTQQAADVLNVSRPHLVKLLNAGDLPFGKVGTHRRVRVADLLDYKVKSLAERRTVIDDMVALSQDLGLD